MAFWSGLFAKKCLDCGSRIVGEPPVVVDGGQICSPCQGKRVAAEAARVAEIEARRQAEEEARAKFEDRKQFGSDPRSNR